MLLFLILTVVLQEKEGELLVKIKETQELQEKLMQHQNKLIGELEDEHVPGAAEDAELLVPAAAADQGWCIPFPFRVNYDFC